MTRPLVSICIPTYKGAKFIEETIQSVLDQQVEAIEILVFDDGSPDSTKNICHSFNDPRIVYQRNSKNLGPKGNWDKCLAAAKGKYYKLLPHDDLLAPMSLNNHISVLETREDIALVIGTRSIISESGKVLMERAPLGKQSKTFSGKGLVRKTIQSGSNIIGEPGNGLIRTEIARIVGPYDDSHGYTIDLDFWFRVLAHGDAFYTAEPSSSFRIHAESWTSEIGKDQHRDFSGTIEKFSALPDYKIGLKTKLVGRLRSRLNMSVRRYIFKQFAKH